MSANNLREMGLLSRDLRVHVAIASLLRLCLIAYGEWHDAHSPVKYTDADYGVFMDAAGHVARGGSPYERLTYRYTPLVAFMMLPSVLLHSCLGKLLFSALDILCALVMHRILRMRMLDRRTAVTCAWWWLYNPIVVGISTRGNAEALVSVPVLLSLYYIMRKKVVAAAVAHGIAVHLKLYPIIFTLPFLLALDSNFDGTRVTLPNVDSPYGRNDTYKRTSMSLRMTAGLNLHQRNTLRDGRAAQQEGGSLANTSRITFLVVSGLTFTVLFGAMYLLYGREFLNEGYVYHLMRRDNRHNFSAYFYPIYLSMGGTSLSVYERMFAIASFAPQAIAVVLVSIGKRRDLPLTMFASGFVFVAFNKVVTSQYFVWYIALLPLILPSLRMSFSRATVLIGVWLGCQALWLASAYGFEFEGRASFSAMWLYALLFFASNILVLQQVLSHAVRMPTFRRGKLVPFSDPHSSSQKLLEKHAFGSPFVAGYSYGVGSGSSGADGGRKVGEGVSPAMSASRSDPSARLFT